jgi:hypothetical protein
MSTKEAISDLKRQLAEVKDAMRAAQPKPEKSFTPQPYQRWDPTEGMSMPESALREMVGHPCNQVMRTLSKTATHQTAPA